MEQDHEESRRMTILCLCIGLILLGTALFVFDPFSLREEEKPVVVTAEAGNNEKDDKLLVYVVGAVKEPGREAITMMPSRQQAMSFPMQKWKLSIWQRP